MIAMKEEFILCQSTGILKSLILFGRARGSRLSRKHPTGSNELAVVPSGQKKNGNSQALHSRLSEEI